MKDNFSILLKKYRVDNSLSQNDFLVVLMTNNNFLSKLDTVTLSRWENKKTAPSLEKKIRIMKSLNLLSAYLYGIYDFNTKTKLEKSLNIQFGSEINKYKELNNIEESNNTIFELLDDSNKLHKKIKTYLVNQDKGYYSICNEWSVTIGCWHSADIIEAFFIHLYTNDNLYVQGHTNSWNNLYKKNINKNINSILLLDKVVSTKAFYKLSLLYLFEILIKNEHLESVFIHVNTDYFLKLSLNVGFNTITTIKEPSTILNEHMDLNFTCIMKIETIKLLSNKDFLFFCLKNYHDLKIHDPTLLNSLYTPSITVNTLNTK